MVNGLDACPIVTECAAWGRVAERPTETTQHVEKLHTFCLIHRLFHAAAKPGMVSRCAGLTELAVRTGQNVCCLSVDFKAGECLPPGTRGGGACACSDWTLPITPPRCQFMQ